MPEAYDRVRTLVDVKLQYRDYTIPAGSIGQVVEAYDEPEEYAIDIAIPRDDLPNGHTFENVTLTSDQFVVDPG